MYDTITFTEATCYVIGSIIAICLGYVAYRIFQSFSACRELEEHMQQRDQLRAAEEDNIQQPPPQEEGIMYVVEYEKEAPVKYLNKARKSVPKTRTMG